MRVSPVGIVYAGRSALVAQHAGKYSALTHPNPVCVSACWAYAATIAEGIVGEERAAMIAAALQHTGDGEGAKVVRRTIEAALNYAPADYDTQMRWILIALQDAFHRLSSGMGVAEAKTATVMRGGDSDTNGAITGALLGAADDLTSIPTKWRLTITTCRPMRTVGVRHPRPSTYWPDDVLDLSEALLATGATDNSMATIVEGEA